MKKQTKKKKLQACKEPQLVPRPETPKGVVKYFEIGYMHGAPKLHTFTKKELIQVVRHLEKEHRLIERNLYKALERIQNCLP